MLFVEGHLGKVLVQTACIAEVFCRASGSIATLGMRLYYSPGGKAGVSQAGMCALLCMVQPINKAELDARKAWMG